MKIRTFAEELCPPILWQSLRRFRRQLRRMSQSRRRNIQPEHQELDIYWSPEFAKVLDTWGEGTAWHEIQLLLCHCQGKVLDVACGTGKVIETNSRFPQLDIYGCDISELLIGRARDRGISSEKLRVCDATATGFDAEEFDYSYSIGSLEHFTEEGIGALLMESDRVTRNASFHHIPVSRSGINEGWLTTQQSFFNNSVEWWLAKFRAVYPIVYSLPSSWEDDQSYGRWFICVKRFPGQACLGNAPEDKVN
jgi:ubiquinone/menaquinone biosynthesis C-methylase UbiE